MNKAKLITYALTLSASPLAFFLVKLALGTTIGGEGGGVHWAN